MDESRNIQDAVVLTTHERSGYYTTVLGDDIDLHFDSDNGFVLENVLHNVLVAGGSLVIIDEAFFIDVDDMASGLEEFLNEEQHPERLKLIVVCTRRDEGDAFLSFLVMYCGIFNIIYGKSGVDVCIELDRLMSQDNTRRDVLHLASRGKWDNTKRDIELLESNELVLNAQDEEGPYELPPFDPVEQDVYVHAGDRFFMKMHMDITMTML